ncbi:MAG: molybdopterin molybdotransferase MoeA [Myxococcaceae bacterium]|jgi:molybdopterin molybdotransferase|nr:molybdopterin molybdotransferase MoeA [Myxococcaceae bacterium]MCA3014474.1 molybdopterin molybdotransferase MoeA [Myxococcaceae bacterium]
MALLTVEEALARVLSSCRVMSAEAVPVGEAIGRAVSETVVARRTLPPWDNSAMDGFAVRADDVTGPGVALRLASTIHAGQPATGPLEPGTSARIMTGAPVPPGADAVIMQERARAADGAVTFDEVPKRGQNVRRRGEDVEQGQPLVASGTVLGVSEAGALWGQGLSRVSVHGAPRVAIASSGDELCGVDEEPRGRIVDTNSPVIEQLALRSGARPTVLGRAPDTLEGLVELLSRGLDHDVLITLSGASVGERDFTRTALRHLGVELDFWGVAMKPGKPLAMGRRGQTLVFALPGNPVSAMVTFELFVRPALRALQGLPPRPEPLPGRLASRLTGAAGLHLFVRASVERRGNELWAHPLKNQSSGALTSATGATHLISVPPGATQSDQGAPVDLLPVSWGG